MSNDIIVGGSDSTKTGNSWVRTNNDIDIYISENIYTYNVHDVYLGFSLIIFKNSIEGDIFKNMLNNITDEKYILDYLENLLIKNISTQQLKTAIDLKVKNSFIEGRNSKVHELRSLLEFE